jgi:hypothetical protein
VRASAGKHYQAGSGGLILRPVGIFYVAGEIFLVQLDWKVRKFGYFRNGMRFARQPSASAKPGCCKFGIDAKKNRLQLLRRGTGSVSSPLWAGVPRND